MTADLAGSIPYFLLLATLVGASAFFSGTEVAMFSLRRVDREQMLRSQRRADQLVVRLLARPRRLIATVLVGNEFVNVSVSVTAAALAHHLFTGAGELGLTLIATAVALPLLLFFGEITPKTLAFKTAPAWARLASRPLQAFGIAIAPVRAIVRLIADLIVRPFGGATLQAVPKDLSEDEFKALVDAGSAEGEVDARERRLIHKVFEFGDKTVAEVMMPRDQVFALPYDLPVARLVHEIGARGYSRVPIYQKSFDNVRGIVYARDLVLPGVGLHQPGVLADLLHEPLFVPQTLPAERLFRIFKAKKKHLAIVVNEYGKVAGLVTMEDLLEELFGEIRDERELLKSAAAAPPPATPRGPEEEVETS
jgi:putative hemolysin